jgi:hypothetical protein
MKVNDIAASLTAQGLQFHWLTDAAGRPMQATLANGALALSVDAAIIIPDVHLGIGRGDCFQETDPTRVARFASFLNVLARLRDSLPPQRFAAVQLGDFFDVTRTTAPGASFDTRLDILFGAYPEIMRVATALPLLHCIGNHDHELFDNRAELPARGINAHIVRALGGGVLAFHGNDFVSLADVELDVNYQTWLLSLVQSVVTMPVIGPAIDALQRYFDASLQDPIFGDTNNTSLAWPVPPAGSVFPAGWSAPWVFRDGAAQLGQPLLCWEQDVGQQVTLAILGHSHRPGIGWTQIGFNRRVPLVDVGSWTYGRTNFAVVGTDGIGVAELVG